jgi:hypothetical protein
MEGVAQAVVGVLVVVIVSALALILAGKFYAIDVGLTGTANTTYYAVWATIWSALNLLGLLPFTVIAVAIISLIAGAFYYRSSNM